MKIDKPDIYVFSVDGKYGPWIQTGSCSKSCDTGSQTFIRKCDSPPPSNGGKDCVGISKKVGICNTHACPGNKGKRKYTY